MALIKSIKGLTPKWGRECYFSENATIVGEVTMATNALCGSMPWFVATWHR